METNNIGNKLLFIVYRVAVNLIALGFAAAIFKHVSVSDFAILVLASVILTVLNFIIKPLLLMISLPFIFLTLGFGYLIVNALIILLMSWAVSGYNVDGFWTAVGVSLIVSIVNVAFDFFAQSRADRF